MESVYDWGCEFIIAVQEMGGPLFDTFFKVATFTGEEMFYLLFVPILFWAIDHRIGARVGFAFLLTAYVNPVLKDLFDMTCSYGDHCPRPCEICLDVCKIPESGSGMPSGHAQSSVFFWGTLAWQVGRRWFWGLAIIWMFLVGFSRIYLGVHFPHQVIAGWIVGATLLLLFIFLDPRFETWMVRQPLGQQLAISIGVPTLMAIAWPRESTVASAAVMCGFGSGFVLMRRYCPYSAKGLWWQRVLRTVIGLAGLLALYFGMGFIAPEAGEVADLLYYVTRFLPYFGMRLDSSAEAQIADLLYYGTRFLRYGVVGLWISFGAPWIFNLLRPIRQPEPELEPQPALD